MALTTQVKDKIKIIKVDKTSCSKAYFLFSLLFVVCFYIISGRIVVVFFFQAEDGIRGLIVTGVQTCALPISANSGSGGLDVASVAPPVSGDASTEMALSDSIEPCSPMRSSSTTLPSDIDSGGSGGGTAARPCDDRAARA